MKRVCAHPQALGQCRGWLEKNLNGVECIAVSSNAEGARRARDEIGTAAIASEVAAEIYELKILVPRIEDHDDNTTRFLVLGMKSLPASGADKTTLLVSATATAEAGALFRLLEPLARHKVSMSRIESRPSRRRKWDYVFFIDLDGHVTDAPVAAALQGTAGARLAVPGAGLLSTGGPVTVGDDLARRQCARWRPTSSASPSANWRVSWALREGDIIKLASNENPLGPSAAGPAGHAARAGRCVAVSGWQWP